MHLENVDSCIISAISEQTDLERDIWSLPNANKREAGHGFFQYPAMMVPAVQKKLLSLITEVQPRINKVFDPFMGAGTSITSAMRLGLDCYGRDINPLAVLVSQAKSGPFYCKGFKDRVNEVLSQAKSDQRASLEADFPNIEKWFQADVAIELSRLRRAIREVKSKWCRRFLWVAMAETVRLTSNDRTTTFKLHIRNKKELESRDISVMNTFERVVSKNIEDLESFYQELNESGLLSRGWFAHRLELQLGDSSETFKNSKGKTEKFDLVITSPPYGDNKTTVTYGQYSYLPLQWIDLADIAKDANSDFLRSTHEIDTRSLGGRTSKHSKEHVEELSERSVTLKQIFSELKKLPKDRINKVANFYKDLDQCLFSISSSINKNGYLLWTVGNRRVGGHLVPTDNILTELFEEYNIHLITSTTRTIHSKRMPTRNSISKMMKNENILIFRAS